MGEYKKLTPKDLRLDFELLPAFDTTSEISPFKDVIGQQRAVDAIDLGLLMDKSGYNIYVSGKNGCGKKSYVIKKVSEYAKKLETPCDWCYVYNFKDSNKPSVLWLKTGTAEDFKNDIETFINSLFEDVPEYFSDESYEKERNIIIENYQKEILKYVERLYEESKKKGFNVKNTNDGFAFIPLIDGKDEMTEKQYNELPEEDKNSINEKAAYLKLIALDVIRKTKYLKKEMNDKIKDLDNRISLTIVERKINELIEKYSYNSRIVEYLKDMQDDVIENIDAFMDYDEYDEKFDENFFKKYFVNIMVSNKEGEGAPVIYEAIPEYHNLIGIIEYENKQGTLVTDFTMIKPGSLHRANGGFIIIDALQLITSYQGWDALKRCIKSKKIFIENLKNQFDIIPLATLEPEEIPLKIKVILLGNPLIYYILFNYDDDFKEMFKIKADFEEEIRKDEGTVLKLLGFISSYCEENGIIPITRDGIVEIMKYSSRLAENRNYFTASFDKIVDVIDLAAIEANKRADNKIDRCHIRNAVSAIEKRHSILKDRIIEMYKEGKYIVTLSGYKVGEINALSVIDYGDFVFGKQNRITVTTFAGKDGVINIERETQMSGNIHNKGIMILSGYIGETFGQNMPVSFNANICFEQLYGEIDGDSASTAELLALMSSLGDIPIKQSIAVTGSINQKGEIQPVGGINEKIEGYFDICSVYGLDGSHGVIIPFSNIDELVLKDEVIDAVEKNKFHIYAVKNIDECMEILMDERLKGNGKAMDIVKSRIANKMEKYKNSFTDRKKK